MRPSRRRGSPCGVAAGMREGLLGRELGWVVRKWDVLISGQKLPEILSCGTLVSVCLALRTDGLCRGSQVLAAVTSRPTNLNDNINSE